SQQGFLIALQCIESIRFIVVVYRDHITARMHNLFTGEENLFVPLQFKKRRDFISINGNRMRSKHQCLLGFLEVSFCITFIRTFHYGMEVLTNGLHVSVSCLLVFSKLMECTALINQMRHSARGEASSLFLDIVRFFALVCIV